MGTWTRAELKGRAKENIGKNYWLCVGVSLLMFLSVGIGSIGIGNKYWKFFSEYKNKHYSISGSQYAYQTEQDTQSTRMNTSFEDSGSREMALLHHYEEGHHYDYDDNDYDIDDFYDDDDYDIDDFYDDDDYDIDDFYDDDDYDIDGFYDDNDYNIYDDYYHNHEYRGSMGEALYILKKGLWLLLITFLISFVISLAISVLVYMPLQVGSCRFFMCNREDNADLNHLLIGFRDGNYLNVVKIMFIRSIKIALWSLLFVIPGIIKSYEYSMIPYLLSENPGMSKQEAFALSREMTSGEKWKMFVLGISFFPWMLLGGVTFGLIFIFWLYPYIFATNAELYAVLREKLRLNSGRIVGTENLRYAYAGGNQNQSYSNYSTQQQMYNNYSNGYEKDNNTQDSYSNNYSSQNDKYSNNSYNGSSGEQKSYGNTLDDFDKKNNPPKNLF
ncbi:MAG: DUF975 family protein [Lachnospiraceae bacterium]|nr:DUF975 family protein [Lachnospiraceae bacterium]